MQDLRIYLETSVWSHVFHDETPDFQRATIEFLNQARHRLWIPCLSTLVLDEVAQADELRQKQLMSEIANPLEVLYE